MRLRVALVCSAPRPEVRALAVDLAVAGHEPELVAAPAAARRLDGLLEWRGYEPGAAGVALLARAAARRAPDAVHAFTIAEAAAAARSGRRAVWSVLAPVGRAELASRRSRLRLLGEAVDGCLVLAADDAVATSLDRWLGVRAPVAAPAELPGRLAGLLGG